MGTITKTKISPLALGLALGVFWGLSVLIFGLLAHFFSYGEVFVTSLGALYKGYTISIGGSFLGGLMGFIDGFFSGLIISWLYNLFLCCCNKDCKKK